MKVLHVTSYDRLGGAGIAAFRLHQALRKEGVDSRMLVRTKGSSDPFVTEVGDRQSEFTLPKVHSLWSKALTSRLAVRGRGWLGAKVTRLLGMEGCSFNIFPTGLHKILNASDADVIHLHWVNNELISIKEIAKIKKPLVWTLHDCWPFLGAEHHSDADYWRRKSVGGRTSNVECTSHIPHPTIHRVYRAANNWVFQRKKKYWQRLNVCFVAPSNWMAEQVRQSKLFADAPVEVIPNGLDTNVFKPMDQMECRQKFDLPQDKNLILFGAYNPLEPNKGSDLLEKALLGMPEELRGNTDLVVFGVGGEHNIAGLKTHWMGVVSSEKKLAELYNAADLVCVPSRKESFGQTASESLACGVPVVAFRASGLMDIVDHKENGYLAEPFDVGDLSDGIQWVFDVQERMGVEVCGSEGVVGSDALSINGREKAECCFANETVARDYATLYEKVLKAG